MNFINRIRFQQRNKNSIKKALKQVMLLILVILVTKDEKKEASVCC
jgi:hypothetical protein